jgi:hypothetical protein
LFKREKLIRSFSISVRFLYSANSGSKWSYHIPLDHLAEMETVDREGDRQEEQAPEKNGVLSESGFGWVKEPIYSAGTTGSRNMTSWLVRERVQNGEMGDFPRELLNQIEL